jgi:hypothetical protein
MDAYFRKIDEVLEVQPMPDEYKESQTEILCNDCEQRCTTKYHFVYHKVSRHYPGSKENCTCISEPRLSCFCVMPEISFAKEIQKCLKIFIHK